MIYVTGDCHGNFDRFNRREFPQQKGMTKQDYVIVCGDFGLWDETSMNYLKTLDARTFTTLWVDGNHENYDRIAQFGQQEWHGGKVQFIFPSVIHLMRGQVFELDGLKFFTFGGARSHDMEGGILRRDDPLFRRRRTRLKRRGISYRVYRESWWEEEMPTAQEMEEGRRNLEKHGWRVDYVITHCAATSVQRLVAGEEYAEDELTNYLEEIRNRCYYRKWFFGHYHKDQVVSDREILLEKEILPIRQPGEPAK